MIRICVQGLVYIGQQTKGVFLGDKFLVRFLIISTHAQNFVTLFLQDLVVVAQVAGFSGTSRGLIFRVEVENFLPLKSESLRVFHPDRLR